MGKTELYEFFDKKISMKAIEWVDYEFMVVGKTARISVDKTGEIDLFICNHKDMSAGLGARALTNRLQAVQSQINRSVTELNGEAYIKTRDKDVVLRNMRMFGIRKKVEFSAESLENKRKAMLEVRNGNA